jgi:hypothetical protein
VGNENAPDSIGMSVFCEYPDDDREGYDFNITKYACNRLGCGAEFYMKIDGME